MAIPLQEIVEIVFFRESFSEPRDESRHHLGVQLDEVVLGMPEPASIAQKALDQKWLIRVTPQFRVWQLHSAGMGGEADPASPP
jgi:hypothetical protein